MSSVPVGPLPSNGAPAPAVAALSRRDRAARLAPIAKRAMDIAIAGLALLVAAPFFLIVAALVRADGGPAFYAHPRVGRGGRIFGCLKFRSMVVDSQARLAALLASDAEARAEWEATRKLRHDPRITRIGRFLRATSLDELPQLLNVLRGEMSLVGPRPLLPREVSEYGEALQLYGQVRPGLTGLWQVSGRSKTTFSERVIYDDWYIKNWSLWTDIAILAKTVRTVLRREGAY